VRLLCMSCPVEGICVSLTRGLQGRQRQEFELRLRYSSRRTNLGITDMHIGLGILRKVSACVIAEAIVAVASFVVL
jgi:hypothetical protein